MTARCVCHLWLYGMVLAIGLSRQHCQARHLPYVPCESEQQQVMCGTIPFKAVGERIVCCQLYRPGGYLTAQSYIVKEVAVAALAGTAAAAAAAGVDNGTMTSVNSSSGTAQLEPVVNNTAVPAPLPPPLPAPLPAQSQSPNLLPERPDLDMFSPNRTSISSISSSSTSISSSSSSNKMNDANVFSTNCVPFTRAQIPVFTNPKATTEEMNAAYQLVPQLNSDMIQIIKGYALQNMEASEDSGLQELLQRYRNIGTSISNSGSSSSSSSNRGGSFRHPGGYAGAAQLAFMQQQISAGSVLQVTAMDRLLSGQGVPVKTFGSASTWSIPTGCSASDYEGPYVMSSVAARYGGVNDPSSSPCTDNYPADAPRQTCGHVAFVELDGQMSYKQALAYWATGDVRYAQTALKIIDGWASTNSRFGLPDQNGPLEAAWGCASFSKAMELLVHHPNWGKSFGGDASFAQFQSWVGYILLPQTDKWVESKKPYQTPWQTWATDGNVYANWHASIAECWMAFGILTNDQRRYDKAVDLHQTTVYGYLKWGRGRFAAGRLIGESTETLRDIYHTLFGLGSLLQTAEMAWQANDDDLYSGNGHVLAAAMEVHARIVNAGQDESRLPPGFRFFESMPPPPSGTVWRMNLGKQLWTAVNSTSGAWVADLTDGYKYVLGQKYLPTGWEIGYNHFAGRLGLQLAETTKLLAGNWPEYYEFHWGLGTLTHAGSANTLWQPGVKEFCTLQSAMNHVVASNGSRGRDSITNNAGRLMAVGRGDGAPGSSSSSSGGDSSNTDVGNDSSSNGNNSSSTVQSNNTGGSGSSSSGTGNNSSISGTSDDSSFISNSSSLVHDSRSSIPSNIGSSSDTSLDVQNGGNSTGSASSRDNSSSSSSSSSRQSASRHNSGTPDSSDVVTTDNSAAGTSRSANSSGHGIHGSNSSGVKDDISSSSSSRGHGSSAIGGISRALTSGDGDKANSTSNSSSNASSSSSSSSSGTGDSHSRIGKTASNSTGLNVLNHSTSRRSDSEVEGSSSTAAGSSSSSSSSILVGNSTGPSSDSLQPVGRTNSSIQSSSNSSSNNTGYLNSSTAAVSISTSYPNSSSSSSDMSIIDASDQGHVGNTSAAATAAAGNSSSSSSNSSTRHGADDSGIAPTGSILPPVLGAAAVVAAAAAVAAGCMKRDAGPVLPLGTDGSSTTVTGSSDGLKVLI